MTDSKKASYIRAKIRRAYFSGMLTPLQLQDLKETNLSLKINTATENKRILIDMAVRGEPRPHHKTKLGSACKSYLKKSHNSYDPVFAMDLEDVNPSWLETREGKTQDLKNELIQMAKDGKDRPAYKSKLGNFLYPRIGKNSPRYDPEFAAQLREANPSWFLTQYDRANQSKDKLAQMALEGKSRPSKSTELGRRFLKYVNPNNPCYDAAFAEKMRTLAPGWFITRFDLADDKREELLRMAESGMDKPAWDSELGRVLGRYTNKNEDCYNREFDEKIRALRPDWFRRASKAA